VVQRLLGALLRSESVCSCSEGVWRTPTKKAFASRVLGSRQKKITRRTAQRQSEGAGRACASVWIGALHPRSSVLANGRVQCAYEACRPEHRRVKRQLRVAATAEQPQTQG
jgi:hypothetical protein